MRLSIRESMAEEQAFEMEATMASLGYYSRRGAWITAVPDAEYPWDPHIVKAIRAEFDPAWTPLFCKEAWVTPTKGLIITGRHMVARHVAVPHAEVDVLKCHVPFDRCNGITFKRPLLECMTLEIRAEDEVERDTKGMVRKQLGTYVPFDNRVYLTCKAIWHQNQNMRARDLAKEIEYLQCDAPKESSKGAMEDLRLSLKDDWAYLERKRKAETEDDRRKAAAPPPSRPSVLVGKAAGQGAPA